MKKHAQPWWRQTGLIFTGGWHPLAARLRRGIPPEDIEDAYAWEYSDEHIQRLKGLGMTLLIGQFDRGLGDTDQAESQELARQQAELCHAHGLRHGCYMANTVYFESVLKDYPDCEDWVVKTHEGRRAHYGGEQTFRWVACFNAPSWRQRMKRQIETAVNVVKTDLLHFDNLGVWPEPDSCHCDYCQEAFRAFLSEKYPTDEAQKRRFGITGFGTFRAPNFYMRFSPPWTIDRIGNPLMQDWIEFRSWTVTDYIREMTEYARQLKPDIVIDSNGQSPRGTNQALVSGVDTEAQGAYLDILCDENPDFRRSDDPQAPPAVVTKMRGMNVARRMSKGFLTAYHDTETLAFNIAFGGHPGINTHWGYAEPGRAALNEPQPGVMDLLSHYKQHVDVYANASAAARTAVWRGWQSLAFCSTDTHLSAAVMEQLLFDNRIPFSIVFDGTIADESLGDFDLLILPDTEFVSDEQVAAITRFVERGGALLITERSGQYTVEPRRRTASAFAHLFAEGLSGESAEEVESVNVDPNLQFELRHRAGKPAEATFGAGRVAYLPKIDYIHRPHAFASRYHVHYDGIDSRYWVAPHNAGSILKAIRWLYPGCRPMTFDDAPELRMDYLAWADGSKGATLFRLGESPEPRDLTLTVAGDAEPKSAQLIKPESDAPQPLKWKAVDGGFRTTLPNVGRLAAVRFDG